MDGIGIVVGGIGGLGRGLVGVGFSVLSYVFRSRGFGFFGMGVLVCQGRILGFGMMGVPLDVGSSFLDGPCLRH